MHAGKALGPLAPLLFTAQGIIACPEPIIRARAALAATTAVRELRPQALPIKLLAVAAITTAINVPLGMWREHTEKFSGSWFLAVHASIPFVAMLRKAVIMPKFAILFTIATAIAGQAIGAKLERERLCRAPGRMLVASHSAALLSQAVGQAARPESGPVSFRLGGGKGAPQRRPLPLARTGTLAVSLSGRQGPAVPLITAH